MVVQTRTLSLIPPDLRAAGPASSRCQQVQMLEKSIPFILGLYYLGSCGVYLTGDLLDDFAGCQYWTIHTRRLHPGTFARARKGWYPCTSPATSLCFTHSLTHTFRKQGHLPHLCPTSGQMASELKRLPSNEKNLLSGHSQAACR